MNVKLLLYAAIILLGLAFSSGNDLKGNKRKWYVIIIISLLVLESSLRNVYVGPDTIHYYSSFNSVENMSWGEVLGSFRTAYLEGEGKDPGFTIFMKIINTFTRDFNVFLFFCALPFFIPLGKLLYRYSSSIIQLVFAFTLYVALFHIVALSGVRQQIATGFCFMAFLQLDRNNNWKAILFILLGATIHISALIFAIVPFLRICSPSLIKSVHLASFATIPFVIVYAAPIMLLLASFLANDYYTTYADSESNGSSYTYIILMELLSLFCYIALKKDDLKNDKRKKLLYVMLPMLTMTAPLISLNGAMIRVGQYFTLYMMLLVPAAIDSIAKNVERTALYIGMIAALVFLTMRSGDFDYYFFWQQVSIL